MLFKLLVLFVCFVSVIGANSRPSKPGYCYSANDRVFVRKGVHVQAPGRCGTLACNGNSVYQSQFCKIVPPKSGCWVTSGYQNRAFPNCCPLTWCPTTGRQQRYRTSGK